MTGPFRLQTLLLLLALLLISGCTETSIVTPEPEVTFAPPADGQDSPDTVAPPNDSFAIADTTPSEDTAVPVEDTGPNCAPGEGCFLDPCTSPDDCLSGWCVDHMSQGVCTKTCESECPQGWTCQLVNATGDATYLCVSPHTQLCRPCANAEGCKTTLGIFDVCVQYDNTGSFCGSACEVSEDCPNGFGCADVTSIDGVAVRQCVPESGECDCSAKDISLGLWTPCTITGPHGSCLGRRTCGEDGLSACKIDEVPPAPCEVSNELGSCQGEQTCTQEGLSACQVDLSVTLACEVSNGFGTCKGKQTCGADGPSACDAATPQAETCNGIDDDCDGETDEDTCDDNNLCTFDQCLDGACDHGFLNGKECLDDNLCTTGDKCLGSQCVGTPVTCYDDNACTDDEDCDPAEGCIFKPNNNPCDDGNACTTDDACGEGACQPGTVPTDCDDNEACTNDTCDPVEGCKYESLESGAPCLDGGFCQAGICKPPIQPSCLAWKKLLPNAPDGAFKIDPDEDGPIKPFEVYCDMSNDGGGWTLVMRDSLDKILKTDTTDAMGTLFWLKLLDGPSVKLDDDTMNLLRSHNDEHITWRVTSPTLGNRYFFPGSCNYKHLSNNDPSCMRFTSVYSDAPTPSYIQCEGWGGGGGGLNAWYACAVDGYTNVVKTHSSFTYGGACITSNPTGASLGKKGGGEEIYPVPGCTYGNKVYIWVR